MPRPWNQAARDPGQALAESFLVNDRMNQLVLELLDPRAWRARPPGARTRTIAAIFSHVHNVRRKWLRLSAPHLPLPAPLSPAGATPAQTAAALAQSAARCCEMLAEALAAPTGRVPAFRRDGWAPEWSAGPPMAAYMIAHDAHHRGQVCLLAHQLGYPLPTARVHKIWAWERLWNECPFPRPR